MTREKILQIAKPILFNTDMVRAILDDRKSATRRVCKDGNENTVPDMKLYDADKRTYGIRCYSDKNHTDIVSIIERKCPICINDYLYVRETWNLLPFYKTYIYKAEKSSNHQTQDIPVGEIGHIKWKPSIHMPKQAARIFLRVTDVRIERLQAMTLEDFLSEGVVLRPEAFNDPENAYQQAKKIFIGIWDSTTNELKYKWNANPWVWVIEFERVEVQ